MFGWLMAALLAIAGVTEPPPPDPTTVGTVNEFLPADRDLDDCISALPQPDCGSEARGGWRQVLVLVAILVGLAVIAWRLVHAARRPRRKVPDDA
jgi:multisubunit Na+/H+ antiporter MnhC subunit